MSLPFDPPLLPMLAQAAPKIPVGTGWRYEPKWDGFRAIVFRDGERVHIGSRNARPLERYFPELVHTLRACLADPVVVDGEIVIAGHDGLNFDALQLRIHPASSRVNMLAEQMPSTFVAFDLLADNEGDHRDDPLDERRHRLLASVEPSENCFLTPQTSDPAQAEEWFHMFEGAGLDGIVAKRHDGVYAPGQRTMIKVKHKRTADCIVAGYRPSVVPDAIGSLLLGIYRDDDLLYVGHTSSFKDEERLAMFGLLQDFVTDESFGQARSPGGPSRWSGAQEKPWVALRPELVCEVTFDHLQGDRFRHGTTFLRWRPDKSPEECTWDQLIPPNPFDLGQIRKMSSA